MYLRVQLYEHHTRSLPDFSPMFDVETALSVLSTGGLGDGRHNSNA